LPGICAIIGENVYPAEVENVLHQIEAIAEAAVIGIADAQWGEVGMAIVAAQRHRQDPQADPAQGFFHCLGHRCGAGLLSTSQVVAPPLLTAIGGFI